MSVTIKANQVKFNTTKINILNTKEIQDTIIKEMCYRKKDLILDFTNVHFIDSTGFTMLHKIKIKSFTDDTNIEYINISNELKELFNLVGFN